MCFKNLATPLIFLVMLSGCTVFKKDYADIGHGITVQTAKELRREKGMEVIGTGGKFLEKVNGLTLYLSYNFPLEIPEARELGLFTLDKYLKNVNENEKVRPYLKNYPFKPANLVIVIFFTETDSRDRPRGELSHISLEEGFIHYKIRGISSGRFEVLKTESIAEAREKLRGQ